MLGAAVFISVLGVNYFLSRYLLEDYIGDLARTTASSTVRKLETVFSSVATSADALASVVSTTGISEKQIREAIRAFMKTSNTIFGMTVALEPHVLQQNIGRFSPYYYRKDGGLASPIWPPQTTTTRNGTGTRNPKPLTSRCGANPTSTPVAVAY